MSTTAAAMPPTIAIFAPRLRFLLTFQNVVVRNLKSLRLPIGLDEEIVIIDLADVTAHFLGRAHLHHDVFAYSKLNYHTFGGGGIRIVLCLVSALRIAQLIEFVIGYFSRGTSSFAARKKLSSPILSTNPRSFVPSASLTLSSVPTPNCSIRCLNRN